MTIDLRLTAKELEPIWQHVARTGFVLRCAFARFAVQCLGHRTREQKMGRESLIDRVAAMSDQSKGLAPYTSWSMAIWPFASSLASYILSRVSETSLTRHCVASGIT